MSLEGRNEDFNLVDATMSLFARILEERTVLGNSQGKVVLCVHDTGIRFAKKSPHGLGLGVHCVHDRYITYEESWPG
ncbi:hypothetical protein HAX54_000043, partial [Datura stramonium]|nr:hypothetical protein [Datura stramonium]